MLQKMWRLCRMTYLWFQRWRLTATTRQPLPLCGPGGQFAVLHDTAGQTVISRACGESQIRSVSAPRKPQWLTRVISKGLQSTPLDGLRPPNLGMPYMVVHDNSARQYFFGVCDKICLPPGST
jgi:hypothetical protein